jgi:hypothetical protein
MMIQPHESLQPSSESELPGALEGDFAAVEKTVQAWRSSSSCTRTTPGFTHTMHFGSLVTISRMPAAWAAETRIGSTVTDDMVERCPDPLVGSEGYQWPLQRSDIAALRDFSNVFTWL